MMIHETEKRRIRIESRVLKNRIEIVGALVVSYSPPAHFWRKPQSDKEMLAAGSIGPDEFQLKYSKNKEQCMAHKPRPRYREGQ